MLRFFGIILAILLFYNIRDVIIALVFAVIVASALEPAIHWCKARRIPRILAVLMIYSAIALFFFLIVYLVFPLLVEDLQGIATTYATLQKRIASEIARIPLLAFFPQLFAISGEDFSGALAAPLESLSGLSGSIVSVTTAAFGGIFSLLLMFVFSFYLAIQERGIEAFLRLVTPVAQEGYVIHVWERAQHKLGRWFRAQVLLCVIVGLLTFFGLALLGVEHAFLFAVLAGLLEIIPIAGPILAAVPAVLSGFLVSPLLGLSTLVLYIIVQQAESNVIVPVVLRKALGLSSLVVILALLIGAKLGGIFGMLISVPVATVLAELLEDWDKKKRALIPE